MTREELTHIHTTTLRMAETPQRVTLKSYVFRLLEALEAAWAERDQLKHRVRELEKDRDDALKEGLALTAEKDGMQIEIDRLRAIAR